MKEKTQIDLNRLKYEIKNMSVRSKLYKLLRDQLTPQGHWKALKRGKPRRFKNVNQ